MTDLPDITEQVNGMFSDAKFQLSETMFQLSCSEPRGLPSTCSISLFQDPVQPGISKLVLSQEVNLPIR